MTMRPRWILAGGILLAIPALGCAQSAAPAPWPPPWAVSSAPARIRVEPENPSYHDTDSVANICLPDPKWATMPMRVFTDEGAAVGSQVLWTAPGEPTVLIFDTKVISRHYWVYVGSNWPALPLPDVKFGGWLEAREGDGKTINNLPDMLQAWKQSTHVLGRALTRGIFEGGNRFGPQQNLLMYEKGWVQVTAPEHLDLSTTSNGASFVLMDGKEVTEWPGLHDAHDGMLGLHQGGVDLAPGLHQLDFYYAYVKPPDGNLPILFCLAARGGAFKDWMMLTPDNSIFRGFAPDDVEGYDLQLNPSGAPAPGNTPELAIQWFNLEQSVIYTDTPDVGLISMRLFCPEPPNGSLTWTFDDGSTVQGTDVQHLFLRPGLRTIHLVVQDGGKQVAAVTETISMHPDWLRPQKQPELRGEQEDDMLSRDPMTLPASDLASCAAVLANFQRPDSLLKILPAVCAKIKDINEPDLPYIKNAALFLTHDDWVHATEEMQLLRALIDRAASIAPPAPATLTVLAESRLALARLVLKTSDHLDEVRALIAAVTVSSLTGEEPRRLNVLQADLALAVGDVEGAKKLYQALTADPTGPDVRSSIRRTAKISQARAFIDTKDYDAAEDALNEVVHQSPIDKMSPDWAVTRLRLYQEENLPVVAYLWAKRMLPVITESNRSELLFRLTDLAFAQGDNDLAHKTLSELLQKHPYSLEAAQAKEKWPGQT